MNVLILLAALAAAPRPVQVGSKNFAESHLLGEIFAQAIEARGVAVDRHFGLGGSLVAFEALKSGALDVYPEYDGTALLVLLKEPLDPPLDPAGGSGGGARHIAERVAQGMAQRGFSWLIPLGFSDDWVLAIPATLSAREKLVSIGDLPGALNRGVRLTGGFSAEFLDRADGLHALEHAYGFTLPEARPMSEPLKYAAIAEGKLDLIDASSTDARLEALHLVGLGDDRHFFPSYQCAPLARADLATREPTAQAALLALAGRIDLATMRRLNALVVGGSSDHQVAADFLASERLVAPSAKREAVHATLLEFLAEKRSYLGRLLVRHLELTFGALAVATLLGLALGLLASRRPLAESLVLKSVGIAQTIPGLPLLAFLVPWLGIGVWPSLVALFLYALLPIVQATHAGLTSIDPDLLWVATGQGMTDRQLTRWIRFPLAAPVALSGIRVAAVTTVGNATLAGFVGGGGLGEPILSGLTLNDTRLILLGAVPAALLALAMDAALAFLSKRLAPLR